jgi:hypothetical protein
MEKIISKAQLKQQMNKKLHALAEHLTQEDRTLARQSVGRFLQREPNASGEILVSHAFISRYLNNSVADIEVAVHLYDILYPRVQARQKALVSKMPKG